MARPLRLEFEDAIYHITARGNRRERIFASDADRARFLETLGEVCQRTGWRVHAFVLMSNHYHLLVGTPAGMSKYLDTTLRFSGANVVVNVESYHAPSGFSWAAPHLQGLAMRVADTKPLRGAGVPFREF